MTTVPTTKRGRRRTRGALAALAFAVAAGVAMGPADAATEPAVGSVTAALGAFPGDLGVASQSSTDTLQVWFTDRPDRGLGAALSPGTSPAIMINPQNTRLYRIAFQGANHDLWTYDILNTPRPPTPAWA